MQKDWADSPRSSNSLLTGKDPPVAVVTNPGGLSPFLFVGDHAGRQIPSRLGDLGLPPEALEQHIAWDIGVAGLGQIIAQSLDAVFIRQSYSRLVIDCNRHPDAPDAIPAVSDGWVIPANAGLGAGERAARRAAVSQPYHEAIAAELDRRALSGRPTWLIALHSFTPVLQGVARPWRMGVLHRGDSALSHAVLLLLQRSLGAQAGDNQPYSMDQIDYTVPLHADPRGLDYLELEVRQDLLADAAGELQVAEQLAPLLSAALEAVREARAGA